MGLWDLSELEVGPLLNSLDVVTGKHWCVVDEVLVARFSDDKPEVQSEKDWEELVNFSFYPVYSLIAVCTG